MFGVIHVSIWIISIFLFQNVKCEKFDKIWTGEEARLGRVGQAQPSLYPPLPNQTHALYTTGFTIQHQLFYHCREGSNLHQKGSLSIFEAAKLEIVQNQNRFLYFIKKLFEIRIPWKFAKNEDILNIFSWGFYF